MADSPAHREGAHPTAATYIKVALTLAVLTAIEFGVFYLEMPNLVLITVFLLLSLVKFALVILFYMHLKFDSRLFSGVFIGGLVLAVAVSIALMAIFQVLDTLANPSEPDGENGVVVGPTPTPTPTQVVSECAPDDRICQGRELFLNVPASAAPQALWCSQCHALGDIADGAIGPDLTNIAVNGATRKPGMSAEEYIRESIREPEAFLCEVELCTQGLMTASVTGGLTNDEVDLLVEFLMSATAADDTQAPVVDVMVPTTPADASTDAPAPAGGLVAEGQSLFMTPPPNVGPQALWCSQCHAIEGLADGLIGPDLTNIGAVAASRKPGTSAEEYLVESLRNPDGFIPDGVERATPGLMTLAIVQDLTDEQVDALVAFLLAQQ